MENFYLKQNEEFSSIIDKIKLSHNADIVLNVPSGINAFKSIINLRILKEESGFLGKSVYIATSDALVKKLAQQAGLKILKTPGGMQATEPRRTAGRVVDLRAMSDIVMPKRQEIVEEEVEEIVEPIFSEPLPAKPEKIRKIRHFKIFTPKFFIGLLILLGVLGLAFLVYFVLPRAQVVITPQKEKVKFSVGITVDKNIDATNLEQAKIPGQLFELEKMSSREFPTTGEKQVEEKAKGVIMVYNQYSSSPQTLVKTTRFRATNGKIFRLTSTVTIPGAVIDEGKIIASSKEVDVEADEAGDTYNIGPSDFNIPGFEGTPKYTAFYGKSTNPMTGGAKGKMKVVTDSDIKGATNIVALELKDETLKEFQGKIPADLKLLKDNQTLAIVESISSLKVNQPGEKFTITVRTKASGLAFKEGTRCIWLKKTLAMKFRKTRPFCCRASKSITKFRNWI